ncbi:TolC family protein [Geobacter sp.]|uniref:TolC family protein n=1 Tax=Geobacter sp. TaxID=46610 RepID=UPI001AC82027|nr:TolC family protein [Geobacter sp.]CAG0944345.1 hypothetical protein ANRL1_01705 [Anaerolineae bacterium]
MNRIVSVIIVIFLLGRVAGAEPLTLDECINWALQEDTGLKSVEMGAAASAEEVAVSKAGFFPSLKLKATYSLIDRPGRLTIDQGLFGTNTPPEKVDVSTNDQDFFFLNLVLDQPLFTGGRLTHTLRKSETAKDEALFHFEREREALVFQVKKNYYDVLTAQLQREVAQKILEAKKERFRVLEELYREGYVRKDEVLRQDADIALAELDVFRSDNREKLALSNLGQLIKHAGSDSLTLTGIPQSLSLVAPLREVTKFAVENRKDLKIAQTRVRGADEDIAIAKSAYYPQATLQGNYFRQKETNITRPDLWMVSASLDWTIFEWGKTSAEVRQKNAQKQRLQFAREKQEQTVALDAERAWRDVREKEESVKALEKRVKVFEYLAGQTAERYAEGAVKLVDVLEAETQLVREYKEYMIAVNDLNGAVASLELATSGAPAAWFVPQRLYAPNVKAISPIITPPPAIEHAPPSSRRHDSAPQEFQAIPYSPPALSQRVAKRFDPPAGSLERDIADLLLGGFQDDKVIIP